MIGSVSCDAMSEESESCLCEPVVIGNVSTVEKSWVRVICELVTGIEIEIFCYYLFSFYLE